MLYLIPNIVNQEIQILLISKDCGLIIWLLMKSHHIICQAYLKLMI